MLREKRIHCALCQRELGTVKAYSPWRRAGDPIRHCSCGGCGDDGVHQEWVLLHRVDTDVYAPAAVMGMVFLNSLILPMLPDAVKLLLFIVSMLLACAGYLQEEVRDASIERMYSDLHLDHLRRLNLMTEEQYQCWYKGNLRLHMFETHKQPNRAQLQRINSTTRIYANQDYIYCPKCGRTLKRVLTANNGNLTQLWGSPVIRCSCGAIARDINRNEKVLSFKGRSLLGAALISGMLYGLLLMLSLCCIGVSMTGGSIIGFVVICDLITIHSIITIRASQKRMRDPQHLEALRTLQILSEDAYQAWMVQHTQTCFDKQPISED